MEKKIITDKERIAKLKERRAVLNDWVKSLKREVQKQKKEVRTEQLINASLRTVIYGAGMPNWGIPEMSALVNYMQQLIKEKIELEQTVEALRSDNIEKMHRKFGQYVVKSSFMGRVTKKIINVDWVCGKN